MKWLMRTLRVVCASVLLLAMLAFAAVHFQQNLLRWRAERLMTDMHRIRLYESNWADAQRLMDRWGAWGHYDGRCSVTDCRYEINMGDACYRAGLSLSGNTWEWLRRLKVYPLYRWFGGRYARVHVAFIVQDGTIWRTNSEVDIDVPPKLLDKEDEGYVLMVEARSQEALHRTEDGGPVFGDLDQLAQHPYYKAGRPGGCEGCVRVGITYSTRTPQSEIQRLTSFDFSCLTRLVSCKIPKDLLPTAGESHNYADNHPDYQASAISQPPKPCDIPVWALGREAVSAFVVDAIPTSEQEKAAYGKEKSEADLVSETASVKIVEQLKGGYTWSPGTVVEAETFPGRHYNPPPQLPEHLTLGNRYILLASSENHRHEGSLFILKTALEMRSEWPTASNKNGCKH
jgi:hypothetical protein